MSAQRGELRVLETPTAVAAATADAFVEDARDAVRERGSFSVALAGGTTPRAAYALLASEPLRARVPWEQTHVYFGDERCVDPTSDQSNFAMAQQTLLGKVPIPPENVHRMKGESPPLEAARAYAEELTAALGDPPVFDLILLGMGPDGHTASLFPGSDPLADDRLLVRAPFVAKLGAYRLTMTPKVINAARHVLIAIEGAAKAAIFQAVREDPIDPSLLPVQIVSPTSGTLTWIADRAAASRLSAPVRSP